MVALRARPWACLLGLALSMTALEARADSTAQDKAAADTLYDQAKKLMTAGKFEEACPKLAESHRLDPGVGTLLTLGECYDHIGRRASAWTTFREAAALAKTRNQTAREKTARARAAQVEPKLAKLIIDVPETSQVADITVKRDDEQVGKPLWGTAIPVDIGSHTISAQAPGHKPWSFTVRVEKDGQLVTVTVPLLPADASKPAGSSAPPPKGEGPPAKPGNTQRILAFTAGGVGLGGIGAGVALGFFALERHNEAQAKCTPTCAAGGGDAIQADAQKLALGSTIAFTAGGLLVAGGVVLLITAPSAKTASLRVVPLITGSEQGLVFQGAF